MYHKFFIHSFIDGYLDCFHVFAIVISAAVNIRVHVSFSVMILSGYVPRSGIAGSKGTFGEGNGNPLHCSCLENPRDGGAWWASVYGVAQSRTRLKRLSSSN